MVAELTFPMNQEDILAKMDWVNTYAYTEIHMFVTLRVLKKSFGPIISSIKRFTKAMNVLSDYRTSVDQPVISRITKAWSRRFKVYRETRSVFLQLIKNMNLRQEQLCYQIMADLIAIAR